ncbi:MAG: dihydrofolate reductase family protein [Clostridium sp.]|uniref:dihydrofolate reductase family protein n=1 Tax=Clostridium sp. TaxID=1506 RepID=UPI002FC9EC3E
MKLVLNLAISLDGYICDENGGFDWIAGDGDNSLNTSNKMEFNDFLETIDVVVMGKKCYDQGFHKDFQDKKVYVATNTPMNNYDNIEFISGDICSIIEDDVLNRGNNIYLFGGGIVIDPFIKKNIIDEYIIGIIPTILGGGRRLFLESNPKIDLHMEEYSSKDGVMVIKYTKR